jgi:hypothetical protein
MTYPDVSARIALMRNLVYDLEHELNGGMVPPPEGLKGFREAIDDIRLRLWVLTAGSTPNQQSAALQRARAERMRDMCRALTADLGGDRGTLDARELRELRYAAAELAAHVEGLPPIFTRGQVAGLLLLLTIVLAVAGWYLMR